MASKLVVGGRKWVSTELKGDDVRKFKEYCRDMHISFETSEVNYGYTHFECLMTETEMCQANIFIDEYLNGNPKTVWYYLKHDVYGICDVCAISLENAKQKAILFLGGAPEQWYERF